MLVEGPNCIGGEGEVLVLEDVGIDLYRARGIEGARLSLD